MTSQSFHPSTDSGMTCDGPVPVMLQETSLLSVIDFGKGEGEVHGLKLQQPLIITPNSPCGTQLPTAGGEAPLSEEPAKTIKKKKRKD